MKGARQRDLSYDRDIDCDITKPFNDQQSNVSIVLPNSNVSMASDVNVTRGTFMSQNDQNRQSVGSNVQQSNSKRRHNLEPPGSPKFGGVVQVNEDSRMSMLKQSELEQAESKLNTYQALAPLDVEEMHDMPMHINHVNSLVEPPKQATDLKNPNGAMIDSFCYNSSEGP